MTTLKHLLLACFIISGMTLILAAAEAHAADAPPSEPSEETTQEEQSPEDLLLLYMAKNKAYEQVVQPLIKQNILTISYKCTEPQSAQRLTPHVFEPVTFPAKTFEDESYKHPTYGQWQDRIEITACGQSYIFNFLAVAAPYGPPAIFPLVNGESMLDPIYQSQAEQKAAEAINEHDHNLCEGGGQTLVSDTKFLGFIQEDRTLGAEDAEKGWFEEWTIWYCRDVRTARIAVIQRKNLSFEIFARYVRPQ